MPSIQLGKHLGHGHLISDNSISNNNSCLPKWDTILPSGIDWVTELTLYMIISVNIPAQPEEVGASLIILILQMRNQKLSEAE